MNAARRALRLWYTLFGVAWTIGVVFLIFVAMTSRP